MSSRACRAGVAFWGSEARPVFVSGMGKIKGRGDGGEELVMDHVLVLVSALTIHLYVRTSNCRRTRQGGTAEPLASAVAPSLFCWLTLIDRQNSTNTGGEGCVMDFQRESE